MMALKDLMAGLGSANLDCRQDGAQLDGARRDFYLFNTSVAGIEDADAILLVGSNPRRESPVLNARIRKAHVNNNAPVGLVGAPADLTYSHVHLGDGPDAVRALIEGRDEIVVDPEISRRARGAVERMIAIGSSGGGGE